MYRDNALCSTRSKFSKVFYKKGDRMKVRIASLIILLLSAVGNLQAVPTFDSLRSMFENTVDKINKPMDQVVNQNGVCGDHVRWPKLALTVAVAYMVYKQPKVQEVVRKITLPIRCALFAGKEVKDSKKNALKKRVKGWQKS